MIVRATWLRWLAALVTSCPSALAEPRWPSLEEAVDLARKSAPSVVAAQVDESVASAARVGAGRPSLLNPSLDFVGARSRITQGVEVTGTLSQPVEIAGQRSARLESSDRLRTWRGAGVELARAQAVGHVVRAHGAALVAASRLALARRGEDDARAEVAVYEARLSVRDTTRHAESIARVELARWAQARAEAELDLDTALEPHVGRVSRALRARIVVDNADGALRPGLFLRAAVPIAHEAVAGRLAVPAGAVQPLGEHDVVFVEREPGTFEVRKVGVTRRTSQVVELGEGLSVGERVAVAGAFLLRGEATRQ
jgi:hypothetical protein